MICLTCKLISIKEQQILTLYVERIFPPQLDLSFENYYWQVIEIHITICMASLD